MIWLSNRLLLSVCFLGGILVAGRPQGVLYEMVTFDALNDDLLIPLGGSPSEPLNNLDLVVVENQDNSLERQEQSQMESTSKSGVPPADIPSSPDSRSESKGIPDVVIELTVPDIARVKPVERPFVGPRTVTSTRTSTHTIPVVATVLEQDITTVVIHTVHTLTVTSSPTITASPVILVNTIQATVTTTEVPSHLPEDSYVPPQLANVAPLISEKASDATPPNSLTLVDPIIHNGQASSQRIPSPIEAPPQLPEPIYPIQNVKTEPLQPLQPALPILPILQVQQVQLAEPKEVPVSDGLVHDDLFEATGKLGDSITLNDLQKMFRDQFEKFRNEFNPGNSASFSSVIIEPTQSETTVEQSSSVPSSTILTPTPISTPLRTSGLMDFGYGLPIMETDLDRIIKEVLPGVDDTTKDSVRKVLNSILKIDEGLESKPKPNETPEVYEIQTSSLAVSDSPSTPIQRTESVDDGRMNWIRPSAASAAMTLGSAAAASELISSTGLTDKDQSEVEKYFSLLNLGRLKGLPEDAVHDLLDFLRAEDKHQFVDDFRQRPFLKKIGLDVTNVTPDRGTASIGTSMFVPDANSVDIERDISDITDFDTLDKEVELYLSEHPIELERESEDDGSTAEDTDIEDFDNDKEGLEFDKSSDNESDDDDDLALEANGVLKDSLRRLTKSPTGRQLNLVEKQRKSKQSSKGSKNAIDKEPAVEFDKDDINDDYETFGGSKFSSKLGKKPKMKKIDDDGFEEEIDFYDPEEDLFPTKDSKRVPLGSNSSKGSRTGTITSKNHNNEETRLKNLGKKGDKKHLTSDEFIIGALSSNSTSSASENSTIPVKAGTGTSSHDRFADLVKTTKPTNDEKDKQGALDAYLEKVKKNPSSLFHGVNSETDGSSGKSTGGSKAKSEKTSKVSSDGFFDFTSNSSPRPTSTFTSSSLLSAVIVIVAMCIILV